MNKVLIIGRVSREPAMAMTISKIPVLNLDIETQEKWIDKDGTHKKKTTFHKAIQWGALAHTTYDLVRKGTLVAVEGSLSVSSSINEYGKKENRTEIKIQIIEVLNEHGITEKYPGEE